MKTYFSLKIGLAVGIVSVLMISSCQNDEISEASLLEEVKELELTEDAEESDPTLRINTSLVFPTTARLFGKCSEDWAIEFGKKIYTFDCEKMFTPQLLNLSDKVVAPFSLGLENIPEEYTINKDQFVFLSPSFVLNDYPCPEEDWVPAPGQSLEDFLKETAKEYLDPFEKIEVFIDGKEIDEVIKYRLSTDLFYFTGNLELVECFDPCVTGEPQPAVIDGYFMMLKKLKVGKHTILVRGEAPSLDFAFEWNLILNVVN